MRAARHRVRAPRWLPLIPFTLGAVAVGGLLGTRAVERWPACPVQERPKEVPLRFETERTLARGEVHTYVFPLAAGELLHLILDQRGVDLTAVLLGPSGRPLLIADRPTGDEGPEPILVIARRSGRHLLRVRALNRDATGRYRLRFIARRRAGREERRRAAAAAAFAEAEQLQAGADDGRRQGALAGYRRAAQLWSADDERTDRALALRRIGQISLARGDLRGATTAFAQALAQCREAGEPKEEIHLLNELGKAHDRLGELPKAEAYYRQALVLAKRRQNRLGEATALNGLGVLSVNRGETTEALELYRQALTGWRASGDRQREAVTLHNLGSAYSLLGRLPEALAVLESALALRRAAGEPRAEAETLYAIAWVRALSGQPRVALRLYDRALAVARATGDRRTEAAVSDRRGTALRQLRRTGAAAAAYRHALRIVRLMGDRQGEANTLANLGTLHREAGQPARALELLDRAIPLFRQGGGRHGLAHTLLESARTLRRLGRLGEARERAEEALAVAESLRVEMPGAAFRIPYLATRYEYYEFTIDLLMELHRKEPRRGLDAQALTLTERARARSLLDQLAARRDGLHRAPLAPLTAAEIQGRILDGETVLIEYALGGERSFVWLVTAHSLISRELPGKAALEAAARRAYLLLSRSRQAGVRRQSQLASGVLADLVLEPIARDLKPGQRLVVVADGALLSIPFGALPRPGSGARPLLAEHEILQLPSASMLAFLPRTPQRPRHTGTIAVVADPVFGVSDPRVEPSASRDVTAPSALYSRLSHARQEADAVVRSFPPSSRRLVAFDFAAGRELVLSGQLVGYGILHFATHGLLDDEHPERSGLVLSLVDPRGRPRAGVVRAGEIAGLDLPADLVVLSACRTALGREARGEGLLSLTRAFWRAGAARVMVSLWNVDDQATAELMGRFYRALLTGGQRPSTALRAAQLSLRADPRWAPPYYWAGFILQGNWEPLD